MDQPSGRLRSIASDSDALTNRNKQDESSKESHCFRTPNGLQVNLPEKCASTTEETTPQYIVDEEAILQLMRTCPVCSRKCRCSKHTRGPYLIVYRSCYFCDYQCKWASQPEARAMNIHKTQTLPKRKLPAKGDVNTKAESSQPNRTGVSDPSASPEKQSQHT